MRGYELVEARSGQEADARPWFVGPKGWKEPECMERGMGYMAMLLTYYSFPVQDPQRQFGCFCYFAR
jgi:hypothetical protein